jgi:hypothetical protein
LARTRETPPHVAEKSRRLMIEVEAAQYDRHNSPVFFPFAARISVDLLNSLLYQLRQQQLH